MAVDKEANSLSRVYSYYSKFNNAKGEPTIKNTDPNGETVGDGIEALTR